MKNLIAFLFLIALVTSCRNEARDNSLKELERALAELETEAVEEEAYTRYTAANRFSVEVPDNMTESDNLHDDAALQFSDIFSDSYAMILDEDKEQAIDAIKSVGAYDEKISVIDNYTDFLLTDIREKNNVLRESRIRKKKIDGLEARIIALDANIDGIPETVSYWLGFVEGKEDFYYIWAWTSENRKSEFEREANEIIRSFEEF